MESYFPTTLTVALAIAGPASIRLKNTGELKRIPPIVTLLLLLITCFTTLTYLFYFSWSLLGWKQLLLYIAVATIVGGPLARVDDKTVVWTMFVLPILIATALTIHLLRGI